MFIPIPQLPDPNLPRYTALPDHTFPAASLSVWMEIAQAAGVKVIGAERVGDLNVKNLLHFESEEDPDVAATMAQLDEINASLKDNEMLRWDCCAGFQTKLYMGDGERPEGENRHLHPGEPRTFDILYEFPSDTISIWKRPWVDASIMNGFPVEFRVFVIEGEVAGIANYYLQRDLPRNPQIERWAGECMQSSQKIVEQILKDHRFPAMPGADVPAFELRGIDCSLDFLVSQEGEVLFLEAGPGFGFGAHPCAFLEGRDVAPIEGLKLASGQAAIPLDEIGGPPQALKVRTPGP